MLDEPFMACQVFIIPQRTTRLKKLLNLLDVEAEMHHVAVVHDILLTFQTKLA